MVKRILLDSILVTLGGDTLPKAPNLAQRTPSVSSAAGPVRRKQVTTPNLPHQPGVGMTPRNPSSPVPSASPASPALPQHGGGQDRRVSGSSNPIGYGGQQTQMDQGAYVQQSPLAQPRPSSTASSQGSLRQQHPPHPAGGTSGPPTTGTARPGMPHSATVPSQHPVSSAQEQSYSLQGSHNVQGLPIQTVRLGQQPQQPQYAQQQQAQLPHLQQQQQLNQQPQHLNQPPLQRQQLQQAQRLQQPPHYQQALQPQHPQQRHQHQPPPHPPTFPPLHHSYTAPAGPVTMNHTYAIQPPNPLDLLNLTCKSCERTIYCGETFSSCVTCAQATPPQYHNFCSSCNLAAHAHQTQTRHYSLKNKFIREEGTRQPYCCSQCKNDQDGGIVVTCGGGCNTQDQWCLTCQKNNTAIHACGMVNVRFTLSTPESVQLRKKHEHLTRVATCKGCNRGLGYSTWLVFVPIGWLTGFQPSRELLHLPRIVERSTRRHF